MAKMTTKNKGEGWKQTRANQMTAMVQWNMQSNKQQCCQVFLVQIPKNKQTKTNWSTSIPSHKQVWRTDIMIKTSIKMKLLGLPVTRQSNTTQANIYSKNTSCMHHGTCLAPFHKPTPNVYHSVIAASLEKWWMHKIFKYLVNDKIMKDLRGLHTSGIKCRINLITKVSVEKENEAFSGDFNHGLFTCKLIKPLYILLFHSYFNRHHYTVLKDWTSSFHRQTDKVNKPS